MFVSSFGVGSKAVGNSPQAKAKNVAVDQPYVALAPGKLSTAYWHIHPFSNEPDDINFSESHPGDVEHFAAANAYRVSHGKKPYTFYLGGRDGSFDTLTYIPKDASHPDNDKGYKGYFPWSAGGS